MKRLAHLIIITPLIIFLFIVCCLWRGLNHDPHAIPIPPSLINHPVPKFTAATLLDANKTVNQTILKNHLITMLNVFASWCTSCQVEHPILMDINRSHTVNLVGLNYKDQRNDVLPWLKKLGNPYQTIIYDPQGQLGINLGVYGTPETFIIDSQGIIRYKYIGPITPDIWQQELLPLITSLQKH